MLRGRGGGGEVGAVDLKEVRITEFMSSVE
jgi:hypothetical protein